MYLLFSKKDGITWYSELLFLAENNGIWFLFWGFIILHLKVNNIFENKYK